MNELVAVVLIGSIAFLMSMVGLTGCIRELRVIASDQQDEIKKLQARLHVVETTPEWQRIAEKEETWNTGSDYEDLDEAA